MTATKSNPDLHCRHCGDSFDDPEWDCPSPDAGREPYKDSGRGGHRFDAATPEPSKPMTKERMREIRKLVTEALNEPTGMRPPYGDWSGRIEVEMARAMLENMKEEQLSQSNMDDLCAALRLVCNEVDLLRGALVTLPELLAEIGCLQTECKRLQRVGLENARIGGDPVFTREQIERIMDDDITPRLARGARRKITP